MGIRVDEESMKNQLMLAGKEERAQLPFHRELLAGKMPLCIGGGLGQSRICMVILQKCHIGEVQVSQWPQKMRKECEEKGVFLL